MTPGSGTPGGWALSACGKWNIIDSRRRRCYPQPIACGFGRSPRPGARGGGEWATKERPEGLPRSAGQRSGVRRRRRALASAAAYFDFFAAGRQRTPTPPDRRALSFLPPALLSLALAGGYCTRLAGGWGRGIGTPGGRAHGARPARHRNARRAAHIGGQPPEGPGRRMAAETRRQQRAGRSPVRRAAAPSGKGEQTAGAHVATCSPLGNIVSRCPGCACSPRRFSSIPARVYTHGRGRA